MESCPTSKEVAECSANGSVNGETLIVLWVESPTLLYTGEHADGNDY